jgi:ubiquitin-protein ligase
VTLSPRIRRLKLDHDQLLQRFAGWPLIQISGTAGLPPEVYRFVYHIKGLYVSSNGEIQEREQHHLEVNLSLGYPRRAPQCRMLTPVFHPNFDDATVCIGDFWAASEGLDDLIVRIGRMIAYQEYNTKSPLNGLAAKWAEQHAGLFPVEPREIAPPLDKPAKPESIQEPVVSEQEKIVEEKIATERAVGTSDAVGSNGAGLESQNGTAASEETRPDGVATE